jgi:hypothetical protein
VGIIESVGTIDPNHSYAMYPGNVQHLWALLARTVGALEGDEVEFWDGGVVRLSVGCTTPVNNLILDLLPVWI